MAGLLYVSVLAVLLALSGFFSGIETAMMSLSMPKVKTLVQQKKKGADALYRLKQNPHKLIITILIGNNLVNIASASIATVVFIDLFGSAGIGVATGIMTFFILVFGEITPKTFATQNAEIMSLKAARIIEILSKVFGISVTLLEKFSRIVTNLFGNNKKGELSEEELKTIVTMGEQEGVLNEEAAEMMHKILRFKEIKVVNIMTPRSQIRMLDGSKTLKQNLDYIIDQGYSRYPVYLEHADRIIGILNRDDVLKYIKNKKIDVLLKSLVKKVAYVPATTKVERLFSKLKGKRMPMVIVVDEYENIIGLVTMEDILEEIVGDIFDKSSRNSIYIKVADSKHITVDAQASVEEINEELHLGLNTEHFNTLAGFIENHLQKIPNKNDVVKLGKVRIVVDKVSNKGVQSVRIIRK